MIDKYLFKDLDKNSTTINTWCVRHGMMSYDGLELNDAVKLYEQIIMEGENE